jgi:hypothetical protein
MIYTASLFDSEEGRMEAWQLDERTPVEHRLFGVDRRYLLPALLVLAVGLLWAVVMPAADESISKDEIEPGAVSQLHGGVSFAPAAGWVQGTPQLGVANEVDIFSGGMSFSIRSGDFEGTSEELLEQVVAHDGELKIEGELRAVQTTQGISGVAREIFGSDYVGGLFAFTNEGVGVAVVTDGPPTVVDQYTEDVARMIASITFPEEDAS